MENTSSPVNNKKKKALVLGGTAPHAELIRQLKERGYYTILIDYLENPPAKIEADEHLLESTLDKDTVYSIALEREVDLVITTSIDQANITACYVLEKLGKHTPYSYETAVAVTNKGVMKEDMIKHNIPTSKYLYFGDGEEYVGLENLRLPVIVKPADSNSAKGVKIAKTFAEAEMYLKEAAEISRTGRAIVEEYVSGIEASVYGFVSNHHAKVIMITERLSIIEGENKAIKCYGTLTHIPMSHETRAKIEKTLDDIAQVYGFDNTPLFMQIIISDDDISVIEFAPRTGGGMCYQTIATNTGFNYIGSAIDSFIDTPVTPEFTPPKSVYAETILYATEGVFDHLVGVDELLSLGEIDGCYLVKTKGTAVTPGSATGERVAFLLLHGETREEIRDRVKMIIEKIDVIDVNGNSILRRDIHL